MAKWSFGRSLHKSILMLCALKWLVILKLFGPDHLSTSLPLSLCLPMRIANALSDKRLCGRNINTHNTALAAVAAGYQLKRGALKPLLEIETSPGQAIQWLLGHSSPLLSGGSAASFPTTSNQCGV